MRWCNKSSICLDCIQFVYNFISPSTNVVEMSQWPAPDPPTNKQIHRVATRAASALVKKRAARVLLNKSQKMSNAAPPKAFISCGFAKKSQCGYDLLGFVKGAWFSHNTHRLGPDPWRLASLRPHCLTQHFECVHVPWWVLRKSAWPGGLSRTPKVYVVWSHDLW